MDAHDICKNARFWKPAAMPMAPPSIVQFIVVKPIFFYGFSQERFSVLDLISFSDKHAVLYRMCQIFLKSRAFNKFFQLNEPFVNLFVSKFTAKLLKCFFMFPY